MPEKTMTEKEMFLQTWDNEYLTTLKLLRAYPPAKADFKPAEKSRTAKELAWMFVNQEQVLDGCIKGQIDFSVGSRPTPANFSDVISAFEKGHREMLDKVKKWPEEDFNRTTAFPVGPKQVAEVRKGQICWTMLMDAVHHRGQLSVYLRMVGAKVPSIYGPSADEPWM